MTTPMVMGILRHALTIAGGALVTSGYLSGAELETAAGAVATLVGLGLSIWVKRGASAA